MRRRRSQTLLLVASGLALILFALSLGCSSAPRERIVRCITDPSRGYMHCDGQSIPYTEAYDYVCHKLEDDEDESLHHC
jgi:hypothetical protein